MWASGRKQRVESARRMLLKTGTLFIKAKKKKINKIQTHSGGTTDYGHHTHKLEIQYYANFVIAARSRENPSSLFTLHPSPSPRYALHRDRRHWPKCPSYLGNCQGLRTYTCTHTRARPEFRFIITGPAAVTARTCGSNRVKSAVAMRRGKRERSSSWAAGGWAGRTRALGFHATRASSPRVFELNPRF